MSVPTILPESGLWLIQEYRKAATPLWVILDGRDPASPLDIHHTAARKDQLQHLAQSYKSQLTRLLEQLSIAAEQRNIDAEPIVELMQNMGMGLLYGPTDAQWKVADLRMGRLEVRLKGEPANALAAVESNKAIVSLALVLTPIIRDLRLFLKTIRGNAQMRNAIEEARANRDVLRGAFTAEQVVAARQKTRAEHIEISGAAAITSLQQLYDLEPFKSDEKFNTALTHGADVVERLVEIAKWAAPAFKAQDYWVENLAAAIDAIIGRLMQQVLVAAPNIPPAAVVPKRSKFNEKIATAQAFKKANPTATNKEIAAHIGVKPGSFDTHYASHLR